MERPDCPVIKLQRDVHELEAALKDAVLEIDGLRQKHAAERREWEERATSTMQIGLACLAELKTVVRNDHDRQDYRKMLEENPELFEFVEAVLLANHNKAKGEEYARRILPENGRRAVWRECNSAP